MQIIKKIFAVFVIIALATIDSFALDATTTVSKVPQKYTRKFDDAQAQNIQTNNTNTQNNDTVIRYDVIAMQQYVEDIEKSGDAPLFTEPCSYGANSTNICVDNIFDDANVQMMQALGLVKEYILVKHTKDSICSPAYRSNMLRDYVKCATSDNKTFFEFKFGGVKSHSTFSIQDSVARSLCKLHGGYMIQNTKCVITEGACTQMNASMKKFGYNARFVKGDNLCIPEFNSIEDEKELKTAYNLNNKRFSGLQLNNIYDLEFFIKRYVERELKKQNITLNSFDCNNSFRTFFVNDVSNKNITDDVLTCRINGKQVDFVFDDLTETVNITSTGSTAGLTCIADLGGNFDGKSCLGFTREQCDGANNKNSLNNILKRQGLVGAHWDTMLDTCVLDASESAENLDRINKALVNVGITTAIVLLSAPTGGTLGIIVAVGSTAALVGSGIEEYADYKQQEETHKFLANIQKCENWSGVQKSDCAKTLLGEYITKIRDYEGNIGTNEINAIDDAIPKLLDLINDDDFYKNLGKKLLENGMLEHKTDSQDIIEHDKDGLVKLKNTGMVLVIIGDTLAIGGGIAGKIKTASSAANGLKAPLKIDAAKKLTKSLNKIQQKLVKYEKFINTIDNVSLVNDVNEIQTAPRLFSSGLSNVTTNISPKNVKPVAQTAPMLYDYQKTPDINLIPSNLQM